jgi:hypothetical protein
VRVAIQARRGVLRIRFAGRACMQLVVKGALSGDSHCDTDAVC